MRWINVKDQMPSRQELDECSIIVFDKCEGVFAIQGNGNGYWDPKETGCGCCSDNLYQVTHWMIIEKPDDIG